MHIMAVSAISVLSSSRGSQTVGVVSVILGGMKILLTSSSKHGSTDEVAAVIAERLQAAQIDVETKRPEDVDSVEEYDAFILGSAVYMTKWTPEAVDFTKRFHDVLRAKPSPWGSPAYPRARSPTPCASARCSWPSTRRIT